MEHFAIKDEKVRGKANENSLENNRTWARKDIYDVSFKNFLKAHTCVSLSPVTVNRVDIEIHFWLHIITTLLR